jgi:menaquinone-dependent protoporphyrinogen oxidase
MTEHIAPHDATALVVYASTHGHTARIAARIAEAMRGHGVAVDVRDVVGAKRLDPSPYSAVVVAGSLHRETHQPELVKWVAAQRAALEVRPTVFCSVSLSAAEDTPESHAATQRCIDAFCEKTGWTPTRSERIAGCLQYREYDFFTRQLMRMLMKKWGHETDVSRDHDYTDWDALDVLGTEIAAMAGAPAGVSSA